MKLLQSISLFTFLALSSVAIHPAYAHGDDHKHSHDEKKDKSNPTNN